MANRKLQFGLVAVTFASIMIFATALPAANALTPRNNFDWLSNGHHTAKWPGGPYICGDHLCSPQEWAKMKAELQKAERNPSVCDALKKWQACEPSSQTKSGQ